MVIAEEIRVININNVKPNTYYISESGEVYSKKLKYKMKLQYDKDGYIEIALSTGNKGKRRTWKVHQLVMRVFIGNPPSYMIDPTVDHIDGVIEHNHYTNLRWMERNVNSSIRKNKGIGEMNHEAVLNEMQVIEICELLVQEKYSLEEIANIYHVHKSTISNIKRKKTWKHLTNKYNFRIHKQKNRKESVQQKEEILHLFKDGIPAKTIVKMGYPSTVVYRYGKKLRNNILLAS